MKELSPDTPEVTLTREQLQDWLAGLRDYGCGRNEYWVPTKEAFEALCKLGLSALSETAPTEERLLTKPAQIGATRFGVGIKWSTVINRAEREWEYFHGLKNPRSSPIDEAAPSAIAPSRETEYKRLLGEWLKKSEAHSPEIKEFKGGYQPFLERATRDFLAACERNEPVWP